MDLKPGSDSSKGIKGLYDSLTPLQQGAVVLGGLALLAVAAMPFVFGGSGFAGLFSKSGSASAAKKAAEGELFARKGEPAGTTDAGAVPAAASSPMPDAGDALAGAMRGSSPGLAGGAGMPVGGSAAASGGAGGPLAAQGEVAMGGRPLGGAGASGTNPGGYTTAAQEARGATGRALGADPAPEATARGSAPAEAGRNAGPAETKPGGEVIGRLVDSGGDADGAGVAEDTGKGEPLVGINPFSSGGTDGADEEDDCPPSVAKRYDGMIEAKIKRYISLVEQRRDMGCRGIHCGMYERYCNHSNPLVRRRYAHHCRCDQLACQQQTACAQGHELNCQRDKACGQHVPSNCSGRKCDLDPY